MRIEGAKNPLDNTGVHPESYDICKNMLDMLGYSLSDVENKNISDIDSKVEAIGIKELSSKLQVGEVTLKDIPIDLEALIHALGGIDNIKESQSQGSKVRFFVENDDLVKVNVLKELGASGVIQATGKVTVILGKFSDEISRIVNEKK